MHIILFDDQTWKTLWPFTLTRPVAAVRVGILTIGEKWEKIFSEEVSYLTADYLQAKYKYTPGDDNLFINGSVLPGDNIKREIADLKNNEALAGKNGELIAVRLDRDHAEVFSPDEHKDYNVKQAASSFKAINRPWDIFAMNGDEIFSDFSIVTKGRTSAPLGSTVSFTGKGDIFVEPGAKIEHAIVNTEEGPVYIDKETKIMDGSLIRGPFVLGRGSVVKMGAKIYGPTTIGPFSKAGGEINNCVIFGYSNKAHEGFLGNSVIGEWCNIGADTNTSNLKNNYADVRVWSYIDEKFIDTGLKFCGLFMGDHSKCGINTMFNTGTLVGVFANIFGSGFPRTFIPSFSWGGAHGFSTYKLEKAFEVAGKVMERRNVELSPADMDLLENVFKETEKYRSG